MDWVELLERVFYAAHRRRDVGTFLATAVAPGPATRVLDFGGGDGRVSAALARTHGGRFTVADPDPAALARVAATPRVTAVRIAPRTALPFPDGAFDAVLAVDVLHHVGDARGALEECRRCLRPGGELLVVEYDARAWLPHLFGWIVGRAGRRCRFRSPRQLASLLRDTGFAARAVPLDRLRHGVQATKPSSGAATR